MQDKTAVLARYEGTGSVVRCSHGCIHVQLGPVAISLTEENYLRFVAMLADSAANFELFRQAGGELDFDSTSRPA